MNFWGWRDRMNPFAAYRAINTKIHGKRRVLLEKSEWAKVAEYKSVSQIIDFLSKRDGYKNIFALCKAEDIRRSDLEIILDRKSVGEIEQILHYFSGSYKDFFKTFLLEYEINDLQLILRTISRKENMEGIENFFVHSNKWGLTNYEKLIACRSVSQFIESLKGTIYYSAVKTITQEDMNKREFHLEMKLYILFYKELFEKASKLKAKDEAIAKELLGEKVDFINAQWIYRAIKYYDISPEEILVYSLPGGNKLTYSKLKALSYAKNIEDLKKMTEKYLAYSLFGQKEDAFLDSMTNRYFLKKIGNMKHEDENIQYVLGHIFMLDIEMNDLIALTEGIRYALPESEIKKFLAHNI